MNEEIGAISSRSVFPTTAGSITTGCGLWLKDCCPNPLSLLIRFSGIPGIPNFEL